MFRELQRLPERVPPLLGESLRGYLMRVAENNNLSGADRLLRDSVGGSRLPITTRRALILADYCRCDIPEFFQLFGIENRSPDGMRQWQLAGEVISKDYFLRPGKPSLCPDCLREERYLRGQWEITMYIACPSHDCMLLTDCPSCKKAISPHRANLDACNCGFQFCEVDCPQATPEAAWVAALINRFLSGDSKTTSHSIKSVGSISTRNRLAALSLDSLFKSFWFFGHYIDAIVPMAVGRSRPDAHGVMQMLRKTIAMLDTWPESFLDVLTRRAQRIDPSRSSHPEKGLAPLRNYLESELSDENLAFIRVAYDRFIQDAWRNRAYATYRKRSATQLELF